MRRDIASLAARLMAEDGVDDYGLAKRKAARQLGVADSEALPTNQAVEAALLAYQALYQGDEQPQRLARLRREALAMMYRLQAFHPYLTGPVLTGTAGRHSPVAIDLYADNSKEVEIFLLDQRLDFVHVDPGRGPDVPELRLHVTGRAAASDRTTDFLLSVHAHSQERVRRRNPHTGQSVPRANIDALQALLAAGGGD